ncbi:MAG TPA: lipid A-modifier LpxR family protein [Anaeromyxobacteraceae bacterium]|nr:lipid A-modifier LpxR family protein [Anaeromyxobacteraceae bacterium]
MRLPGAHEQRFFIQEENDVFGITRQSDNYYTQGLRLGARWKPRADLRLVRQEGASELWGFELGQNIYTPNDIRLTDLGVLRRDRPYAGYLYVGPTFDLRWRWNPIPRWARIRAGAGETDEAFSSTLHLEARLGQTGPSALGGAVQTGFHVLLRDIAGNDSQALPAGWRLYETANARSVDITVEYAADWIRIGAPVAWLNLTHCTGSRLAVRVLPGARLDLGGIVDAAGLGLEARAGLAEADVGSPSATSRPRTPLELYLWGRAQGRFVAYSRLIEGRLLDGVTTEVGLRRWVGDVTAGLTLRVFALEFVAAQQWRTAEIEPLPAGTSATDNFGSFQISFLFY